MNSNERYCLDILYDCISIITIMQPKNPADIKAKLKNLNSITNAGKLMQQGVIDLRMRAHKDAELNLRKAHEMLRCKEAGR